MPEAVTRLWAPWARLGDGPGARWQPQVLLAVDERGRFAAVEPGVAEPPADARRLPGPLLPGLVDAHSHAFQRAFAGLSQRREGDGDDFWSWRDRMYGVALRITPEQLRAVAGQLYAELLCGGYTQVCEFHYLHHRPDGREWDDPLAMAWTLADAAEDAGLGLTMLPVLYERAGFAQPALREDQRRFRTEPAWVVQAQRRLAGAGRPGLSAGVAIHSLRAASQASIRALLAAVGDREGPVHIHVAEQTQEVDDCLAATGERPIAWLCRHLPVDERWQLVHATHATPEEIDATKARGAGVVVCPGTEGDLGDGFLHLPRWLDAGVPVAIGSDSHATRAWPEELRWLEYGQRLLHRRRNVGADPAQGEPSTAARLFDAALAAGAGAAGLPRGGLVPGARADWLVLDPADDALLGLPADRWLDGLVFSAPSRAIDEVAVAGRVVVRGGRHVHDARLRAAFARAMAELWEQPLP